MRQFVDGLYGGENSRKRFIGRLVHHFLTAVHYVEMEEFASPLLRWRVGMAPGQKAFLDVLKDLVVREVITSPAVQHLEFKVRRWWWPCSRRCRLIRGACCPVTVCLRMINMGCGRFATMWRR
jgi:hypothetical protein